jgi:hypothetical protein
MECTAPVPYTMFRLTAAAKIIATADAGLPLTGLGRKSTPVRFDNVMTSH